MGREISILFLGGDWSKNIIGDVDMGFPGPDNTFGYQAQLRTWITANGSHPDGYLYRDGSVGKGDYAYMLRDSTFIGVNEVDTFWNVAVAPNLPVDLVVLEGGYRNCLTGITNPVTASTNFQISDGDTYGVDCLLLASQLLRSGANACMFVSLGLPDYSPATVNGGSFPFLASRTGDHLHSLPFTVSGVVSAPDLREVLQPVSTYYALATGGGDNVVPRIAGATEASIQVGMAIEAIPTYLLQPDQDGT